MKLATALCATLIVLTGLIAYRSSFSGVLVFDDIPAIARNPNIRSLTPLSRALSAPTEVTVAGRPIVSLSFAINHALAPVEVRDVLELPAPGPPPDGTDRYLRNLWGYHALNLAIHLLAGLTLFGIVRRTLMAIHADAEVVRARSVTTPTGKRRSTSPTRTSASMSSPFAAISLIVALLWVVHPLQTGSVTYVVQRAESLMGLFFLLTLYCAIRAHEPAHRSWWITASITACVLGMGSKESMVVAPILVWLWDHVFARRSPTKPAGGRGPLYLGLACTWGGLGALMLTFPRSHSVGFQFAEWPWWRYLMTQAGVVTHYFRLALIPSPLALDYGWPPAASFVEVAPRAALLLALVAATAWALWRRRPEGFAGAWVFLTLAPTSTIVPVVTEIAAEHRMYLPLAGLVALIVIAADRLLARLPDGSRSWVGVATSAGLVIVFAAQTDARNQDYTSELKIWADTVEKRPDNARARANYGAALQTQGRFSDAERELRISDRLHPNDPDTESGLGTALASQGRFPEALGYLERSVAARDDDSAAHQNLAEAYAASGRLAAALPHFLRAVDLRPNDPFLLNRAGWILATAQDEQLRNGAKAAELASRAVQITAGRDVVSLDTLAAAQAELGRFDAATAAARDALALARAQGNAEMLRELQERLALYEHGKPFRQ